MRHVVVACLMFALVASSAFAQSSPPVGNTFPVQPPRTGSYTIKQSDLKSAIPFNCSSPCTVTFPQVTSSWPKGYAVLIQNIGSAAVTISANTSTLYGMPLTGGSVVLTNLGNFAFVTADSSGNYAAAGFTGSGGGGGGAVSTVNGAGQITVSPNIGNVIVNSFGFSGGITETACTGTGCTPATSCKTFVNGILSSFTTGACTTVATNFMLIQSGSSFLIQTGSHLLIQ